MSGSHAICAGRARGAQICGPATCLLFHRRCLQRMSTTPMSSEKKSSPARAAERPRCALDGCGSKFRDPRTAVGGPYDPMKCTKSYIREGHGQGRIAEGACFSKKSLHFNFCPNSSSHVDAAPRPRRLRLPSAASSPAICGGTPPPKYVAPSHPSHSSWHA